MQHKPQEQDTPPAPLIFELLVLDTQIQYLLQQFAHFPNYTSPIDESYFILNDQQLKQFLEGHPRLQDYTVVKMVSMDKNAAQNLFKKIYPSIEVPMDDQTLISFLEKAICAAIRQRETEVERHHAMLTYLNNRFSKSKK